MMNERIHDEFLKILAEELIPAMGCTEPIALAYAGARAREVLGCLPDRVIAYCSGNMIKNVRCVTIPNSERSASKPASCWELSEAMPPNVWKF